MTDTVIHAAHTQDPHGLIWILFDTHRVLRGLPSEPKSVVLKRWTETHGEAQTIVTHSGIYSTAELSVAIAEHQLGFKGGKGVGQ